ncbi:MAG: SDR family NAD(P)-dependent oxidoreductase [Lachnospiraceae bacterium]
MKYALITGGSSGIGYELARIFSKNGYHIIINGSNKEKLENAKKGLEKEFKNTVQTFVQDLSKPGSAQKLYDQIQNADLEIDILINNAGIGLMDATELIDFTADEQLMHLNVISLVQLCKLFLPQMYRRGKGKILNLASVAAFQPGPFNSTYFASKSFVLSYSRAIRFEAKQKGIQVCTLCPGTTKTKFFDREGIKAPPAAVEPQVVAEYAYRKLMKNQEIIIPGTFNKFSRMIPVSLRIRLSAMMTKLQDS